MEQSTRGIFLLMEGVQLYHPLTRCDLQADMLDTCDNAFCMCGAGRLWLANGKGSALTNALLEESRNAPQFGLTLMLLFCICCKVQVKSRGSIA